MLKYLQLPIVFDAERLKNEVSKLENSNWLSHYQTSHYEGEWNAIPLRSIGGKQDDIFISPIENAVYENTNHLLSCPYIQEVLQYFKCPLLSVRLLNLNAGAIIKEHRDADLCFEKGEVRLHIPVVTNNEVEFFLDNERMVLQEGECWYMNFNLPHRINNKSKINRIHLVIDAKVNDWITQLFADPLIQIKKEIEDPANQYDDQTKKEMIHHLRAMNTEVSIQMADDLEMG